MYCFYQTKWNQQAIEDGLDPVAECAPDRTEYEQVDHDSQVIHQKLKDAARTAERLAERGGGSTRGKRQTSCPMVSRPDDDDCRVIKVFDVMPLNYAYPYSVSDATASAGESAPAEKGKKRATEEPVAEAKRKRIKKTSGRRGSSSASAYAPPKPKPRSVGAG